MTGRMNNTANFFSTVQGFVWKTLFLLTDAERSPYNSSLSTPSAGQIQITWKKKSLSEILNSQNEIPTGSDSISLTKTQSKNLFAKCSASNTPSDVLCQHSNQSVRVMFVKCQNPKLVNLINETTFHFPFFGGWSYVTLCLCYPGVLLTALHGI